MTQLSLERPGNHHHVRSVSSDGVRIGEQIFHGSLLLSPQTIDAWPPQRLTDIEDDHWQQVLALTPDLVLLGTGVQQQFLPPAGLAALYRAGIGIEQMTTEAACRTFNVLAAEERRVVAALLPISAG